MQRMYNRLEGWLRKQTDKMRTSQQRFEVAQQDVAQQDVAQQDVAHKQRIRCFRQAVS